MGVNRLLEFSIVLNEGKASDSKQNKSNGKSLDDSELP
jgi:hypothetical protein